MQSRLRHPHASLERSKKIYTLILKIKDLADGDPANKGLSEVDLENKLLRTGRLGNRGFAALIPFWIFEKIYTLILKIKDLGDGDPENKGLSKVDLENKGLRTGGPGNRGFVALTPP